METKGIIISQKDYKRLTDIEKNFDAKVEENKAKFAKLLKKAIKGNLVKILWVNDQEYAEIVGGGLTDDEITEFASRESADLIDSHSPLMSYDREKLINRPTQKIIETQKLTIRNLWWSFGLTFVAWIIMSIAYITK